MEEGESRIFGLKFTLVVLADDQYEAEDKLKQILSDLFKRKVLYDWDGPL